MSRSIFVVVVFISVFAGCGSKEEAGESTAQGPNDYPDLTLTMEEGGEVATKKLTGNNIFIFFQPDCRHCQEEALAIEERLSEFDGYTLYFISSGSIEAIALFAETFDLDGKDNVKFAQASTQSVLNHYGPIQTPSVYIYAEGKLKQSFNGQTNIENILKAL